MLILIVGPSGAGKDTLLNGARHALAGNASFRFVRRVITRPLAPGDEQHEPVSDDAFARMRDSGHFALHWRAHGLQYGIPADITEDLAQDRTVLANVSRAVVAEAATRFPVAIISITAPPDIRARRLAGRGREDAADVARRLSREIELKLPVERQHVVNDTTPEQGIDRLLAAIRSVTSPAPGHRQ